MVDQPDLATASCVVLAAALAASVIEKAAWLRRGTARWHPVVVRVPFLARCPRAAIGISLGSDAATLGVLLAAPPRGSLIAALLVLGYTPAGLLATRAGDGCRCLTGPLEARTRAGLLGRNLSLVFAGMLGTQARSTRPITDSLDVTVLLLAAFGIGTLVLLVRFLDGRGWAQLPAAADRRR